VLVAFGLLLQQLHQGSPALGLVSTGIP
jgi:hypothetical protein